MLPSLNSVMEVVRRCAREELVPRFMEVGRRIKADGSVVTAADTAMQARLQTELGRRWPEYGFLGEEMSTDEQLTELRGVATGLWCLDPLDGTSNYAAGIPFFAVSLALLLEAVPVLAVVYDPIRDECFAAERERGAGLNGSRLHSQPPRLAMRQCIAVVDFKRLKAPLAGRLGQDPPYGSQRNFGASSLDWCWLAAGRFHLYLHGGQKLWDYAAGHLILSEAGGFSATLEGKPVVSMELGPRSVVAARDEELFTAWRAWIDFNRGEV